MTPLDLKVWRTRQRLTQGDLAHRLGVHINTVNRWETEGSNIPPFLPLALETLERRSHDSGTAPYGDVTLAAV
jgi:DNA-binding transcriptional regulator YiaG